MQVSAVYRQSTIAFCLSALLLTPMPALAALSSTDSAKLDQFEQMIFGGTRHQLSDESRLRALEINVFGKEKTGSESGRLNAIAKALGGKPSTSKFLPPLPGELDRAAYAPLKPKTAPVNSSSSNNPYSSGSPDGYQDNSGDSDASSPTAAPDVAVSESDREKDLLRQALEKHNQGDTAGAEQMFRQVLSMNPRNVDANFNLGAMLEDRGDLNGALHLYQTAASLSPGDHDIQDAVTAVRDKMHQAQVAQQTSAELQQKAQLKGIANDAAASYKAGRYDQAISDLNRIAVQTPNDPNVQFGLGQAWRGKGDLNRARQYLSRAVALAPDNQLYRASLSDLDQDARHQVAHSGGGAPSAGPDGGPPMAPDYTASNSGGHHHRRGGNNYGGGGGDGTQSFDNSDLASNGYSGDPNGGVQPFTSQGESQLYGHEVANGIRSGYGGGGFGGGGLGMGALGALGGIGLSRMMGGNHYYGGTGTRLVRGAMTGALGGAAVGALTGMRSPGGARAGAMRGALYGGLFGLITGF